MPHPLNGVRPQHWGQATTLGSDPIIVAWHRGGALGAYVAPGGPEEGGGGLLPARGASGPLRGFRDEILYLRIVYCRCGSALTDGWIL